MLNSKIYKYTNIIAVMVFAVQTLLVTAIISSWLYYGQKIWWNKKDPL